MGIFASIKKVITFTKDAELPKIAYASVTSETIAENFNSLYFGIVKGLDEQVSVQLITEETKVKLMLNAFGAILQTASQVEQINAQVELINAQRLTEEAKKIGHEKQYKIQVMKNLQEYDSMAMMGAQVAIPGVLGAVGTLASDVSEIPIILNTTAI